MTTEPVHLLRSPERQAPNDALAALAGGRVGLDGVLADLDRVARAAYAPGTRARWAFRWDAEDEASPRWWPQGITGSADGCADETYGGREVLVTTSYSRTLRGVSHGSRITVTDLTDRRRLRYRHVLLVEATLDADGGLGLRPVRAHAGGVVWHGPYLTVAGTAKGLYTFRLDDVVALGAAAGAGGLETYGHRYVLPVRYVHAARSEEGAPAVRYSFVSLDRATEPPGLLAGEFGRGEMTTRLLRYDLDPATDLPGSDDAGVCRPRLLRHGVPGMQGCVAARGRLFVTTSDGPRRRGHLYVEEGDRLVRHARVLPVGPEDVCYWPGRDELWSLTEYPGLRLVFTLDRARFD